MSLRPLLDAVELEVFVFLLLRRLGGIAFGVGADVGNVRLVARFYAVLVEQRGQDGNIIYLAVGEVFVILETQVIIPVRVN